MHPHVVASPSKYIWFRLPVGTDPVEGIAQVIRDLGLDGGSIVECIGSLSQFSFILAQPAEGGNWQFSDPIVKNGTMELLAAQGTWARDGESGEIFVHLHGLVSEHTGNVCGGHFVRGESRVLVTCEVGLLTGPALPMSRRFDPLSKFSVIMANNS